MEHNHQLSSSDSGWTIKAGMTLMILRDNLEPLEMSDFVVPWVHQVMVETVSHQDTSDILMLYMLSPSLMKV